MIFLLACHLGTNYLAVRSVSMRTLNRQRANLVFSDCLEQLIEFGGQTKRKGKIEIPTPEEISLQERIFERGGILRWKGSQTLGYCQIGVDLRKILDLFGPSDMTSRSYTAPQSSDVAKLLDIFRDEGYIMWYDAPRKIFLIVLKNSSNTKAQLHAWMHALFFAKQAGRATENESPVDTLARTLWDINLFTNTFNVFEELQKAGWDIDTGALETRSGTRIKIQ